MSEWINRAAALAQLGVKPQTLYAYVSRGQIGVRPDPADPRRSLYHAEDIATLVGRRSRGRKSAAIAASAMVWGEPALTTAISTVHHGRLFYRGRDAVALARSATLEEVAALLWDAQTPIDLAMPSSVAADPFQALAALVAQSHPSLGRSAVRLHRDAETVIGHIAAALGAGAAQDPVHKRLARAWGLDEIGAAWIRRALVTLADHELNASTFATRVAASTGASMAASLLAGLSTLSGPRHGGASQALMALVDEAARVGVAADIDACLARGQAVPGFGHPLYPNGDPRAALLLESFQFDNLMIELRESVLKAAGVLPNVDFALAAFARAARVPPDAPFALFLLGRSVGWAAHAMEQIRTGDLIRPRARYTGSPPNDAATDLGAIR